MRILPFVLVVPLVVVPTVAYLALTAEGGGRALPVAQGVDGRSLHPVAGSFQPDQTTFDECAGRYSCLEQAFGNVAYADGPRRALALFARAIDTDPDVERDCHRIAHTIGSAVYARNDGNVARTFSQGTPACASGYYHGVLERAFAGVGSVVELRRLAADLCVDLEIPRRSFLDYQCRHGLGHGLMIQTGYDLPTALSVCEGIGTGWDTVTCTGGVFMENVSTRFGFRSPWLDEQRPLAHCDRVPLLHRRSCYLRATTWILEVVENDFARAADVCASVGRWRRSCFRGFGRDAVVEARYVDLETTLSLCGLARTYLGDCVYGAARTFSDGSGLAGAKRAAAFCRSVPAGVHSQCVAGFGLVVGLLHPTPAARRAVCASLAPRHVSSCAAAAAAEVDPSGSQSWG